MKEPVSTMLLYAFAALGFSACATDVSSQPLSPAPNHHRQHLANYIGALPNSGRIPSAGALVSDIQPSVAPQPGVWLACVKLRDGGLFVAFFEDREIVDFRRTVGIDKCSEAPGYKPMPAPVKCNIKENQFPSGPLPPGCKEAAAKEEIELPKPLQYEKIN